MIDRCLIHCDRILFTFSDGKIGTVHLLIWNGGEAIERSSKDISHDERTGSTMTIDIHFYDVDICQHPEILSQVRGLCIHQVKRNLEKKGALKAENNDSHLAFDRGRYSYLIQSPLKKRVIAIYMRGYSISIRLHT